MRSSLLIFSILALFFSTERSFAAGKTDDWFFGDETLQTEVQFNVRFLGHVGSNLVAGTPPGGYFMEGQIGIWLEHFVQGHIQIGKSITGDSALNLGAGLRLNLLEFSKANARDFAAADKTGLYCVESKRGLFAHILRSLLLHADFEANRFWFTPSTPGAYPDSLQGIGWGAGAQWGPNIRIEGVSRIFLESSVSFMRLSGVFYTFPYAGIGMSF